MNRSFVLYVATALISSAKAAAFASITPAPKLAERDAQSICGFWEDPTNGQTWSFYCNGGVNCAIDTYLTPNIVFCSIPGIAPCSTFYSYGSWPTTGCGFQECCCPATSPKVRTHTYDQGASFYYVCDAANANITDGSQNVWTQFREFSIYLSPYSTRQPSVTPTPTPGVTTVIISPTSQPPANSSLATHTSHRDSSSGISPGGITGIVIGTILGTLATVFSVLWCLRWKHRRSPSTVQAPVVPLEYKPELDALPAPFPPGQRQQVSELAASIGNVWELADSERHTGGATSAEEAERVI